MTDSLFGASEFLPARAENDAEGAPRSSSRASPSQTSSTGSSVRTAGRCSGEGRPAVPRGEGTKARRSCPRCPVSLMPIPIGSSVREVQRNPG